MRNDISCFKGGLHVFRFSDKISSSKVFASVLISLTVKVNARSLVGRPFSFSRILLSHLLKPQLRPVAVCVCAKVCQKSKVNI